MPTTGMRTARLACQTIRSATGNTAGPLSPPRVFFSTGRRVFRSMRMPCRVLIRLRPSAPASSQALAIGTISATFGLSFMITGFKETRFTARVTSAAAFGSVPKDMPPPWTFGQEIFTSSQPTWDSRERISQTSAYSSGLKPLTFAITGLR